MRFLLLLLFCSSFAYAQIQVTEPPATPKNEWAPVAPTYQLYLDKPIHKIINVEYLDGTPLKHDLGKDKETVYLLDYHKRGGVKVEAENEKGERLEFRRSPCVIDPVIQS